ncbi:MAG TPA: DUF4388 domain-containing protein [Polyangiaceae bacterium]|nr:DUF4388 domain-containing protein [Polyangiaceae bacterium]
MKTYSLKDARRLTRGTTDWREAVWNKWLIGYLTPRESESEKEELAGEPTRAATTPSEEAPRANPVVTDPVSDPGRPSRGVQALRARLDLIISRMDALEVALDRSSERENLGRVQARVHERALADLLERLVEAQERHTQGLISCTRAIERLERRVLTSERTARPLSTLVPDATGFEGSSFTEGTPDTLIPPSVTRAVRKVALGQGGNREAVAPLSGSLSEISLPTLLSMAELERWTGRLILEARERTVLLELEGGLLVGAFEDDSPAEAVEALHELIEVRDGRFSFSPGASAVKTELAPMTVGTLLLRASHRRDERSRADAI